MAENLDYPSPFTTLISFHKLIESMEIIAHSNVDYRSNYAKAIIQQAKELPEFRNGIEDWNMIQENEGLIKNLLADLFPTALTYNEIKAATLPFQNFTFNYTERFKKILSDAGMEFDMNIRDFDEHLFYVMNCCLILNTYYNQKVDFGKPLFYDIPDADGIIKHYRILYNADFVEIFATEKVKPLQQSEIDELIDNYDNIDLWKEKFPPNTWVLKGFVIVTLIDATIESAVSNLKTNLLKSNVKKTEMKESFESIFRSIFKIADLRVGVTIYNEEEDAFIKPYLEKGKEQMKSFILLDEKEADCKNALCGCSFEYLIKNKKVFIIPDVNAFLMTAENQKFGNHLLSQNIQSCLLAPVMNGDKLLGIMELASSQIRGLNSLNATKLELIMPYLVDTIERNNAEIENKVEAIIQKEYTTIHPSVYWKFKKEARNYFRNTSDTKDYIFKEIVFKDVYPLYGQIDIKSSSDHRNVTIKDDLKHQLVSLIEIFELLKSSTSLLLIEQRKFELQELLNDLEISLKADTEQQIHSYIETEIHPVLQSSKADVECQKKIDVYFGSLDPKSGVFYQARKDFDHTLSVINKKMANILDAKQLEAQQIFPHYYERFKTDGVEHNLYIGASIAPHLEYDKLYLNNLRLWQLQTLCEMELEHHKIKDTLPYALDVTSLILVFSSPLSIRFRMDEKRFDVDGSYNARYEVVKKRIDKAYIKGTKERITEKEKITIVYSHKQEETEYLKYIKFLQSKQILESTVEQFEVEDLQGVSGLKAFRIKVVNTNISSEKLYSYQNLLDELN
ncbi:MAG: GAF domain-containing protein [Flavobacterium sp.]